MYRRFKDRFGTAGLIVAVVALVAALGGSAVALTGAEKKEVKKFSKSFAKKFAKRFAKPGPEGLQGLPGAAGKAGTNGTNGTDGTDGKSVETTALGPEEGGCLEGGTELEVEGSEDPETICNGNPWTAGGTLPSKETEMGGWAANGAGIEPISFPIPLVAGLPGGSLHIVSVTKQEEETQPVGCEGGTAASPSADPGHLCVFVGFGETPAGLFNNAPAGAEPFEEGSGTTGVVLSTTGAGFGSFAVTAP